ncbi:MAG: hypothetical protein AMXMBFR84_50090 [Candidatus Hydrogenedentota bacterium]
MNTSKSYIFFLMGSVVSTCLFSPTADGELPRTTIRSGVAGAPAIIINGDTYSPLFFAANNQFNRDEILLEELRLAADAGFKLYTFNVWLEPFKTPDETVAEVEKFASAHPEGYFYVRIWLGAHRSWLAENPDERIVDSEGNASEMASPASELWRKDTAERLARCIELIAASRYGSKLFGVHLAYLQTGEWFYPDTERYYDYSLPAQQAFRTWLKAKYRTPRSLRKAWSDPAATFDSVQIPTAQEREDNAWGHFRDPVKHAKVIDHQRFLSDQMADTIAYFASEVKRVSNRRLLVGAFYGYTMQLNHNGPRALAHSGHLSLARLLECSDIDIIAAPYAYFERNIGEPGHFHLPLDSLALHGKLGIVEEDSYTHLSSPPQDLLIAPGYPDRTQTMEETQALLRRNFANAFTHRNGMWIFDLLSDGRWNDKAIWDSAKLLLRMAAASRDVPVFEPQIAVLMDEESVHFLQDTTWPVLLQSLAVWLSEFDRMGTPVGYYLQSDIARLPDSVRMIVLANPYVLSEDAQRQIDRLLDLGCTVVLTYAPNAAGGAGSSVLANIAEATGFTVESKTDSMPLRIKSVETDETVALGTDNWANRIVITSDSGHILARYMETDEVSAVARPQGKGVLVYSATPRLPVGLLRWMAQRSGVHVYSNAPGMVGLVGPYLIVHTSQETDLTIQWPDPFDSVDRIVPLSPLPMATKNTTWVDTLPGKSTAVYLVR